MKKLIFITLCIGISLITSSQKVINTKGGPFTPGWYIGANGGMNIFMGEGNNFLNPMLGNNKPFVFDLTHNTSFEGRAEVGYDFTPVIGVRGFLGYIGIQWPNASIKKEDIYNFSSENLTVDFLVNLTNWSKGYNPNRKIDFSAFAGLGMGYRNSNFFDNLSPLSALLRAGFQSDYHITPDVALNLIFEGNIVTDNYNDLALTPLPFDAFAALTIGLTYKLPETASKIDNITVVEPEILPTKPVEPIPVVAEVPAPQLTPEPVPASTVALVSVPTPAVASELQPVPTVVPQPAPVVALAPQPSPIAPVVAPKFWVNIFYPINRTGIVTARQQAAFAKVLDYMNKYPQAKIVVSGYADRGTGTAAVNKRVSKKRAENLAIELTSKNAISSERIITKYYGSSVQPYKQVSMNRLTTIKSEPAKYTKYTMSTSSKFPMDIAKTVKPMAGKMQTGSSKNQTLSEALECVLFSENNSGLKSQKQNDAVMKVALYLRRNPNAKIVVSGYADKKSSKETSNKMISKTRAMNVANSLILKYSIDKKRIQVKWFATGVQPARGDKNRAAIVKVVI